MVERNVVEKIKTSISIVDFISKTIKLKKQSNGRWYGLCPFHREKTPSFSVNEVEQFFYCFGCHESGDIIDFVKKTNGISFIESISQIAAEIGLTIDTKSIEEYDHINVLYRIMSSINDFYNKNIDNHQYKKIAEYLIQVRKLSTKTIEKFQLGYSTISEDLGYKYLLEQGYETKDILHSGIAKAHGVGIHDFFRNKITIPIKDIHGRIIGFGARSLDKNGPKYINSHESLIFKKGDILFNANNAKKHINRSNHAILVEGYMDVLTLDQHGFYGAVASLGTAITEKQTKLLLSIDTSPFICFDSDQAGQKAMFKFIDIILPILSVYMNPKFVILDNAKDVDEMLNANNGNMSFANALHNALTLHDFIWQKELKLHDLSNPSSKSKLETTLSNYAKLITNSRISRNYEYFFRNKIFETSRIHFQKKNNITQKTIPDTHTKLKLQINDIEVVILSIISLIPDALFKNDEIFEQIELKESYELYFEIVSILINSYKYDQRDTYNPSYNHNEMLEKIKISLPKYSDTVDSIIHYNKTLESDNIFKKCPELYLIKSLSLYRIAMLDEEIKKYQNIDKKCLDNLAIERGNAISRIADIDAQIDATVIDD